MPPAMTTCAEPAAMFAQLFAVQINIRLVIRRTKITEEPMIGRGFFNVKYFAIPDGAFVIKKFFVLRIPVARHVERRAGIKIIFHEFGLVLRVMIEREAAVDFRRRIIRLATIVKIARVIRVHDHIPFSVQARRLPREHIADDDFAMRMAGDKARSQQNQKIFFHAR